MSFDGESVWLVGPDSNTLYTMRPSDGAISAQVPLPGPPLRFNGVLHDGARLWLSGQNGGAVVSAEGLVDPAIQVPPSPFGALAFDGAYVYFSDRRVRAASGQWESLPVTATALAFDGRRIWGVNAAGAFLQRLAVDDPAAVVTIPLAAPANAVAFDGSHLWLTEPAGDRLLKLDLDGNQIGAFPVGQDPGALVFDGTHLWVANQGSSSVTRSVWTTARRWGPSTPARARAGWSSTASTSGRPAGSARRSPDSDTTALIRGATGPAEGDD